MKYTVTTDGWLDGAYRTKGEIMDLPADQAKWLAMAGLIAPCEPLAAAPPKDKTTPRRHRGSVD